MSWQYMRSFQSAVYLNQYINIHCVIGT